MPVETGTYISDFNITLPADDGLAGELDDHIRLVKSFTKATFPGTGGDLFDEAVTETSANIDTWDARLTALEALPTTLASPASGYLDMTVDQVYSVTGLGFEPRYVMGFGIIYWPFITQSYHTLSVGSWNADDDDGHRLAITSIGDNIALGSNTGNPGSFLSLTYGNGNSRADIEIAANSDGFDLSFSTYSKSRVLWMAFQ